MLPRLFVLWISMVSCLTMPAHLSSQSNSGTSELLVFPVRVNHKTGYIKIFDQPTGVVSFTIIEPRYDNVMKDQLTYFGTEDKPSPYRLFEMDGKLGLLDEGMNEVLPAKYQQIRVIGVGLFIVETDAAKGFQLLDAKGSVQWEGAVYEEILPAQKQGKFDVFFVKKDGLWGIRKITGEMQLNHSYLSITATEDADMYKIHEKDGGSHWKLINSGGKMLVQSPFEDVRAISPDFFLAKTGDYWNEIIKNPKGDWQITGPKIIYAEKLNDYWCQLVTEREKGSLIQLKALQPSMSPSLEKLPSYLIPAEATNSYISTVRQKKNMDMGGWFYPLDDRFISTYYSETNSFQVIDSTGQISKEKFGRIQPSGYPGAFIVLGGKFGANGLFRPGHPQKKMAFDFGYAEIAPFQGSIAVCKKGDLYGLLGISGETLDSVACIHNNVKVFDGNKAQIQLGDQILMLTFVPGNGFVPQEVVTGAKLVGSNAVFQLREALSSSLQSLDDVKNRQRNQGWWSEPYSAMSIKGNLIEKRMHFGYEDTLIWKITQPPVTNLIKVFEAVSDQVLVIVDGGFSPRKSVSSALGQRDSTRVRFYDIEKKVFLPVAPIVGIRNFADNLEYTAFIDTSSMMGLIDREGREKTGANGPIRFSYIGPFIGGRARVCIGGKWRIDPSNKLKVSEKYKIATLGSFLKEFHIAREIGPPDRAELGIYIFGKHAWAYIDKEGKLIFQTDAAFVGDYIPEAGSTFLRKNDRIVQDRQDADYGILDPNGKELIPPKYSTVQKLLDFFLVSVDSTPTFYFTDAGLQIFVNPTRLRPFSEGMAQFFDSESGLWGYVNRAGKVVITPRFKVARPFSDGMAIVALSDEDCAAIDTAGQVVFSFGKPAKALAVIGDFHGGRCWYKDEGWSWGCCDRAGKTVIAPEIFYQPKGKSPSPDALNPLPMDFKRPIVAGGKEKGGKLLYGFLDTMGQFIATFPELSHLTSPAAHGIAIATDFAQNRRLLHESGKPVSTQSYKTIWPFVHGYARIQSMEGKIGMIDTTGRTVIPAKFAAIDTVWEGRVAVQESNTGKRWILMDTAGNRVGGNTFAVAPGPFDGGISMVKEMGRNFFINHLGQIDSSFDFSYKPLFYSDGLFGFTDEEGQSFYRNSHGNNIFGALFREISPFSLGVARVGPRIPGKKNPVFGAINRRGIQIVPCKYRMVHIQPDGNIVTNPQRFYGLLDKSGKVLLEPIYDLIEKYADTDIFRVEQGEAIGYVKIKDGRVEWIWEMQK